MTWEVRELTAEDLAAFMSASESFFWESRNAATVPNLDKYSHRVAQAIQIDTVKILTVWDQGRIAGYAIINTSDDFTEIPIGDMYQFYVLPEYRGQGVARAIRDAVVKQFDDWGCTISYICCDTGIDDGEAVKLFRNLWAKVGYEVTGLTMSRVKKGQ